MGWLKITLITTADIDIRTSILISPSCTTSLYLRSCLVCAIVLFVTLLAVSIKVIQNDELGIKYHTITKHMHNQVYQEGRYTLQPGEKFFIFKRRYVTNEESGLLCLTQDGLQATLIVTYQYRLIQDQLIAFFQQYGFGYENQIVLLAQTAIRDACGNWTSSGFYYAREQVQADMSNRMAAAFELIHIEAGFLQLSNVALPDDFQNIMKSVQEAKQDSEQAINERAEQLTNAQTDVLKAEQTATIIGVNATADAFSIETEADAQAEVIATQLDVQASTYLSIMLELGLSPEELVNYISLNTIQNSNNPIISVTSPANFAFSANATTGN